MSEVTNDVMAPSDEAAQLADKVGQTVTKGASEDVAQDLSLEP